MPSPSIVKVDQEVEVWTERQPTGGVLWTARADGQDVGTGFSMSHPRALEEAAAMLQARENEARETALRNGVAHA